MDREWDFDEAIKSGYWYVPEFFGEALEKIINPPHRFVTKWPVVSIRNMPHRGGTIRR